MNAIACMSWVKRGVSKQMPDRIKLDEDEIEKLVAKSAAAPASEEGENEDDDADDDTEDAGTSGYDIDKKYQLDNYSDDEDNDDDDEAEDDEENSAAEDSESSESSIEPDDFSKHLESTSSQSSGLGMAGLSYYHSNKHDPYIKDPDSDDEDAEILADDNLLAIGKVNDEVFGLEVYVYNEGSSSLYCHHDTFLGGFPLAMEWVGYDPGETAMGNLLAIGGMKPSIELWDVDVIDTLEPAFVLKGKRKKKSKKKLESSSMGHSDAVLCLAWNSLQQNILASGSADNSVGLWNLDEGKMVVKLEHHADKVQALKWHPFERETLLSGSCDKTVKVYDCQSTDNAHKSWDLPGEVEHVAWNIHDPYCFVAATECGHVSYFDVRTTKPLFILKAHDAAISGVAISTELPGCMVTASADRSFKVWDIRRNKPEKVFEKHHSIGDILCMTPCPDSGFVYAIGGEHELKVIHLKTMPAVMERFKAVENKQTNASPNNDKENDGAKPETKKKDGVSKKRKSEHQPKELGKHKKVKSSSPKNMKKKKKKKAKNTELSKPNKPVVKDSQSSKKLKKKNQISQPAKSESTQKLKKKKKHAKDRN